MVTNSVVMDSDTNGQNAEDQIIYTKKYKLMCKLLGITGLCFRGKSARLSILRLFVAILLLVLGRFLNFLLIIVCQF